ncbi:MAG: hypothetical protein ACNI22_04800 [Halarcobacter sp.]
MIKNLQKEKLLSVNVFGYTALEAAYEFGEEWLEELKNYLKRILNFTKEYLAKSNSKIQFLEPEATYLLWLNFKKYSDLT